ncbi:hypothetical protein L1987_57549 [Smallanthus sonchifolius]|uniref:Uncharacterized protein n=1 Tax=Smallanthus sonchifolius TaxID=185202 RepID=A0ACB9DDL2_9ASTR|nr:hypothetical protein L1987_57549 [Smallanthus sonchifolius]
MEGVYKDSRDYVEECVVNTLIEEQSERTKNAGTNETRILRKGRRKKSTKGHLMFSRESHEGKQGIEYGYELASDESDQDDRELKYSLEYFKELDLQTKKETMKKDSDKGKTPIDDNDDGKRLQPQIVLDS